MTEWKLSYSVFSGISTLFTIGFITTMRKLNIEIDEIKINPQYRLQFEEAQGCHVLLFPEGLIKLSDSAAAILERCQRATTLAKLVEELKIAFPGVDGLEDDVRAFLVDALQEDWVLSAQS